MRSFPGVIVAAVAAAGVIGCGEDERAAPLRVNGPTVALMLEVPGTTPAALVVFKRDDGRRCHALGTLTSEGPRLLGAPGVPLGEALTRGSSRCLAKGSRTVSLDVRAAPSGGGQLVGGLAGPGVRRLTLGGQRIVPNRRGAFLVHRADDLRQRRVVVETRDGRRATVALVADA